MPFGDYGFGDFRVRCSKTEDIVLNPPHSTHGWQVWSVSVPCLGDLYLIVWGNSLSGSQTKHPPLYFVLSCFGFASILNFKVFVLFSYSVTFPVKSWRVVQFLLVIAVETPKTFSDMAPCHFTLQSGCLLSLQAGLARYPDGDTCGILAGCCFLLWASWSFNVLRVKVLKTNYAPQNPCSVLSNPGEPIHPEPDRLQSAEPWCLHWERLTRTLQPPHLANKEAELWGEEESDRGWR